MKHRFGMNPAEHTLTVPLAAGGQATVPVPSIRGASHWGATTALFTEGGGTIEARLDHCDVAALFRILASEHEQIAMREDDTDNVPFS